MDRPYMAAMDNAGDTTNRAAAGSGIAPAYVDILLVAIMLVLAGATLAPRHGSPMPAFGSRSHAASARSPSVPPIPIPAVEPVAFVDMTPDQARDYNATIPFSPDRLQPARPLVFQGSPADRENALTCLASAAWYEAGDDAIGEEAVAQVVLNRARHPAFPKTVCAVVFEGSERKTGCQFTFTCDGSLGRIPPPEQWRRARAIAERALSGFVFKSVGTATHYHTDWVVPYWMSSLAKLTEIHTHIFYRWTGWWGLPQAFSGPLTAPEVIDPRIVALSHPVPAAGQGVPGGVAAIDPADQAAKPASAIAIGGVTDGDLKGNVVRLADPNRGLFVLQLDPHAFAGSYAIVAFSICRARESCRVLGWLRPASLPKALPLDEAATRSATFAYQKAGGRDAALWDCRVIPRGAASQCLPGTASEQPEQGDAKSVSATSTPG